MSTRYDVVVVGAGINGLTAAALLSLEGHSVLVVERAATVGGACRSEPLTGEGAVHDVCAAVHAMAVLSPAFQRLGLEARGVTWLRPAVPVAHPLDGGRAVLLQRSVNATATGLGEDGKTWQRLFGPLADHGAKLLDFVMGPLTRLPRAPLLAARFGTAGLPSAQWVARRAFDHEEARALFAGLAAHSFLALDRPLTSSFALMLGLTAHVGGWPVAQGGSQAVPDALASIVRQHGGEVLTGQEVRSLAELPPSDAVFLDLTPRQVVAVAGDDLPSMIRRPLSRWRYGPGVFKLDYRLSEPVPWAAPGCQDTVTLHLGGTLDEIAASEEQVSEGRHPDRPYVLVAQPTLVDPTRAPAGVHTFWAYCHVPSGSTVDMTDAIEAQIERFAPGFRDTVVARHKVDTASLEADNPNCIGGDISGGAVTGRQIFMRPRLAFAPYHLGGPRSIYLCSSSSPPGPGIHGMCGYWAVKSFLKRMRGDRARAG
jgi:phytoene dehydrogenase-like protein